MQLPKEDGDYPLWLLIAVKESLFCVAADPELEDARFVLQKIDAALTTDRTPEQTEKT